MEVLYANIIKIVIFEPDKRGKATSGKCYQQRGNPRPFISFGATRWVWFSFAQWPPCAGPAPPGNGANGRCGKGDQRSGLPLHCCTNAEWSWPGSPFNKMLITLLIRVGLYQGPDQPRVISRTAFSAPCSPNIQWEPQMFLGSLKVHMWHKLLVAFPLMDQDGLKEVFGTCFPFAPSPAHRGVWSVCGCFPLPRCLAMEGRRCFKTSRTSMLQLLTLKRVWKFGSCSSPNPLCTLLYAVFSPSVEQGVPAAPASSPAGPSRSFEILPAGVSKR